MSAGEPGVRRSMIRLSIQKRVEWVIDSPVRLASKDIISKQT